MEIQRIGHDYPKALAVSFALICGTFGAVILTRTCPDLPPDAAVVSSIYDHLLDDTPASARSAREWGEELRRALESSAHAKKYVLTQEAPPADAWLARFGFFTDGAMQLLAFESPRELFFAVHPDGSILMPEEISLDSVAWSWWLVAKKRGLPISELGELRPIRGISDAGAPVNATPAPPARP